MNTSICIIRQIICCIIGVMPWSGAIADLVFSAPPRETIQAGKEIYDPLASYLSKLLGQRVIYTYPFSWLTYQRDMRDGKYDLAFDGPHLVSWRMAHSGHQPLVKLPSSLKYHVVVLVENETVTELDDLIGRKICAFAPPDFGTLLITSNFLNPIRQPLVHEIREGGFEAIWETLKSGSCEAAILLASFFDALLTDSEQSRAKIIYTTQDQPNQALTVGSRISDKQKQLIAHALVKNPDGVAATAGIRARFDKTADSFVKASPGDYVGHNLLLEGVIFGW